MSLCVYVCVCEVNIQECLLYNYNLIYLFKIARVKQKGLLYDETNSDFIEFFYLKTVLNRCMCIF